VQARLRTAVHAGTSLTNSYVGRAQGTVNIDEQFDAEDGDQHQRGFSDHSTQAEAIESRDDLDSAKPVVQQQQFFSPGDGTDQLLTS
jgi:hypothetical protein